MKRRDYKPGLRVRSATYNAIGRNSEHQPIHGITEGEVFAKGEGIRTQMYCMVRYGQSVREQALSRLVAVEDSP